MPSLWGLTGGRREGNLVYIPINQTAVNPQSSSSEQHVAYMHAGQVMHVHEILLLTEYIIILYLIIVVSSIAVHSVSPREVELPLGQRHCGRNDASCGTITRVFIVANSGT